MRIILLLAALQATALASYMDLQVDSSVQQVPVLPAASCSCDGINQTSPNPTYHFCNNATLGPKILPWRLPLLSLVSNYHRFGRLSPMEFLEKYYIPATPTSSASWRYPNPPQGFAKDVNGNYIKGSYELPLGFKVDRFGDEWGRYISAADAPFSQRALPPDALNVCKNATDPNCPVRSAPWAYYVYEVTRPFVVEAGPIAPGFEQPGGGVQFFLGSDRRLRDVVAAGNLTRLSLQNIEPGPGPSDKCGHKPANCTCVRPEPDMLF